MVTRTSRPQKENSFERRKVTTWTFLNGENVKGSPEEEELFFHHQWTPAYEDGGLKFAWSKVEITP